MPVRAQNRTLSTQRITISLKLNYNFNGSQRLDKFFNKAAMHNKLVT